MVPSNIDLFVNFFSFLLIQVLNDGLKNFLTTNTSRLSDSNAIVTFYYCCLWPDLFLLNELRSYKHFYIFQNALNSYGELCTINTFLCQLFIFDFKNYI